MRPIPRDFIELGKLVAVIHWIEYHKLVAMFSSFFPPLPSSPAYPAFGGGGGGVAGMYPCFAITYIIILHTYYRDQSIVGPINTQTLSFSLSASTIFPHSNRLSTVSVSLLRFPWNFMCFRSARNEQVRYVVSCTATSILSCEWGVNDVVSVSFDVEK
jgi:hypothetical protein